MAPTEFLAVQHYQRISSWLEKLDESERPRVALLTGSTPVSKARVIRSVSVMRVIVVTLIIYTILNYNTLSCDFPRIYSLRLDITTFRNFLAFLFLEVSDKLLITSGWSPVTLSAFCVKCFNSLNVCYRVSKMVRLIWLLARIV